MFKEKTIPLLNNLFQERETERTLVNLFYEVRITFILKPDKGIIRKENYRPISHEYKHTNHQYNTNKSSNE